MRSPLFPRSSSGSTLLLALWALLLLSAAVFAWSDLVRQQIERGSDRNFELNALAVAHSGVAIALDPVITGTSPMLDGNLGYERSYHVTLKSEGDKLNLNYLLAGEDPNRLWLLKEYLRSHGLTYQERETLVDCLLDWVDADDQRHLNGQENENDYHPANRPFLSLDEVKQVRGTAPLFAKHPTWQDDFTLMSTGPLDLEVVSSERLALLPGIGMERAARFVQVRQGRDQIDGTPDDRIFRDANEAMSYLGFTPQQAQSLSGLIGFKDPIVRIVSIGHAGKVNRQVEVIARKVPGSNAQIIQWTEK